MAVALSSERQAGLLPAGIWHVDPAHSSVEFRIKHLMIATVKGRFTGFTGTLEASDEGIVEATGSIETASIDTHEPRRDEHLRSADFFDSDAFPEIAFASTEITLTGGDSFHVLGELTIRGITKPVDLDGTLQGVGRDPWGNDRVALELRGEIDRRDFGLTWNQALETGGVLLGDTVGIELAVSAVKPAA